MATGYFTHGKYSTTDVVQETGWASLLCPHGTGAADVDFSFLFKAFFHLFFFFFFIFSIKSIVELLKRATGITQNRAWSSTWPAAPCCINHGPLEQDFPIKMQQQYNLTEFVANTHVTFSFRARSNGHNAHKGYSKWEETERGISLERQSQ